MRIRKKSAHKVNKKGKRNFQFSMSEVPLRIKELLSFTPFSDKMINIAMMVLLAFGTLMIVSTSMGDPMGSGGNVNMLSHVISSLVKQMVFVVISLAAMLFLNKMFTFRRVYRFRGALLIGFLLAMIAPLFFPEINGSRAWIPIGTMTIQPSEFGKPMAYIIMATAMYRVRKTYKEPDSFMGLLGLPLFLFTFSMVMLLMQKDLGTLAITFMIYFVMFLLPDYHILRRFQRLLKVGFTTVLILGVTLFWVTDIGSRLLINTPFSHVVTRFENAKNPYASMERLYGEGYQPANALYGIADSHIIGKGIGQSNRKYGYLTQASSDYIMAVTIEETGIFGLAIVTIGYMVILYRLLYYALITEQLEFKIILSGTAMHLFMHFFLNIGGITSLIPFTGVPLLFISYGGSSLLSICMGIGVAQQCISHIRISELNEA